MGLSICEFAYSIKVIGNPKVNTGSAFSVIREHAQSSKKNFQ